MKGAQSALPRAHIDLAKYFELSMVEQDACVFVDRKPLQTESTSLNQLTLIIHCPIAPHQFVDAFLIRSISSGINWAKNSESMNSVISAIFGSPFASMLNLKMKIHSHMRG